MSETSIHIDPDLESRASAVLNNLGIDINDAITDYLNKIVNDDSSQESLPRAEVRGILEGKAWISEDFNEPWDDLDGDSSKIVNNRPERVKLEELSKEEIAKRLKFALQKGPRSEAMGIFKGMMWVSDDFDEPLEETVKVLSKIANNLQDPANTRKLSDEEKKEKMRIIKTKGPRAEAYGVLDGLLWLSDDYDEPLECLKEYLE